MYQIYVRQKYFLTAIAGEAEFIHDLFLLRLLNGTLCAVIVRPLAVGITLKFLEATLIVEPLIGKELAAIHTPHRDDHLDMAVGLVNGYSGQFCCCVRPVLQ